MTCRLRTPKEISIGQIKAVVDGIVASAQWMPAPARTVGLEALVGLASDFSERFGFTDGLDPEDLLALASLQDGAVLGPCERLITKDGRINPDDHRLVAGVVAVDHAAGGDLRLEADISTAVPTASEDSL